MYALLIVIHLLTAFVMVGAILLQSGKGAEIGATFGGSSQTIFGGRGATTFLAKFTAGCALVFMLTSLGLAILSKERSLGTSLKLPTPPLAENPRGEPPISKPTEPATSSTMPPAASSSTSAAPAGHEGVAPASPSTQGTATGAPPAASSTAPASPAKP